MPGFTKGFETLHQPRHGKTAHPPQVPPSPPYFVLAPLPFFNPPQPPPPQNAFSTQRLGKKGKGKLSAGEMKALKATLEQASSYNHEVKNTRVLQSGSGKGGGMNSKAGAYREIVASKGYQMPAPIMYTSKKKSSAKIKQDVERLDRVEPMGVPVSRYISEACKQELQDAYIHDPRTVSTVPRHTKVKKEWGLMQSHGHDSKDQRVNVFASGECGISGTAGKRNFPGIQPASLEFS